MGTLALALALGFVGTLAAAVVTFLLGFAGAPGALLTAAATRKRADAAIPVWGWVLTGLCQSYVSLAFVALVVQSVAAWLQGTSGFGKWLVWAVGWWVAGAPAWIALKDSAAAEKKTVQHMATTITAPLTNVGFLLFAFYRPSIHWAWSWVPHW